MATLELNVLRCVRQQDVTGKDEPELFVNNESVFSGVMEKGEAETLDLGIPFDKIARVRLMEKNPHSSKRLGEIEIRTDRDNQNPAVFKTSGAHYLLFYTVTP